MKLRFPKTADQVKVEQSSESSDSTFSQISIDERAVVGNGPSEQGDMVIIPELDRGKPQAVDDHEFAKPRPVSVLLARLVLGNALLVPNPLVRAGCLHSFRFAIQTNPKSHVK
jgi:hypothetical protein